jgi:hypothetical protein
VLKTSDIGLRRGSGGGVGEAEFDAVADCALVVAEPCSCDVPLADLASGSERHGWSDESAVGRHLFRLRVIEGYCVCSLGSVEVLTMSLQLCATLE